MAKRLSGLARRELIVAVRGRYSASAPSVKREILREFVAITGYHRKSAIRILNDNVTAFIYLVGVFILGVHLWHGFAAAFQSLGITHPRYAGFIKWFGVLFAIVIALSFASFVVFARMSPKSKVQSPKSSQSEQVSSLTLDFAPVLGATGGRFGPPVRMPADVRGADDSNSYEISTATSLHCERSLIYDPKTLAGQSPRQ